MGVQDTVWYATNNIMKKLRLIPLLVAILAIGFGGGYLYGTDDMRSRTVAQAPVEIVKPAPTREELLRLVNEERAKVGVAPLVEDIRLSWSAQQKADDMAKYHYTGHFSDNSPNQSGDARQWLLASGVQCSGSSENITYRKTAKDAVASWVGSEAHYKAMVNPEYTTTGFGLVDGIQVEHFCKQA